MVLYDDKKWLCRLIRTAFTIEDDTGKVQKLTKVLHINLEFYSKILIKYCLILLEGVCEKVLRTKAALPPVGYKQDGDSSSISSVESYDIRGK